MKTHNVNLIEWRIKMLGRFGGFSYRAIAHEVFGEYTAKEKLAIYRTLKKNGIKLKDWRDLESLVAKRYAKTIKKPNRAKSA